MDSPTGITHTSSFVVIRVTVSFMLSKSHNWSRTRHPLVDGTSEVLEYEGVDGGVVRRSAIWFRGSLEEENRTSSATKEGMISIHPGSSSCIHYKVGFIKSETEGVLLGDEDLPQVN